MPARMRKLYSRGDTIIEVLIAMAVISSVLAISYATMNRNSLTIQDSQERTEATKMLQGQVESLRNAYRTTLPAIPPSGSFCMSADGTATAPVSGSSPTATLAAEPSDWSTYASCNFGPLITSTDHLYHIAITTADHKTYKFYIRWDRIGTGLRDELQMVYKVN